MSIINTIEFFDKNGHNCNFSYDETNTFYVGNMYFPRISSGLHETLNIYIYDKIEFNGNAFFGKFQSELSNPINYEIRWYWKDDKFRGVEEIFVYDIDSDFNINKQTFISQKTDFANHYTGLSSSGRKIVTDYDHEPNKVSIALFSENEGIFEKTLIVEFHNTDTGEQIKLAEIGLYGEVESEDERLNELLENFAIDFPQQDEFIFLDSDPLENRVDFTLLNEKRKELLLRIRDIKNFEMSYAGLIEIIKFYGYNLGIKEYWKNIDATSPNYGSYKLIDVIENLQSDLFGVNGVEVLNKPNRVYSKTNFLKLVYNINQIVPGKFTDDFLPITEETSLYSVEDVLLKLYALKTRLSEKWLPINIKILDITAEADYFTRIDTVGYSLDQKIDDAEISIYPILEVTPSNNGHINDLRKVLFEVSSTYDLLGNPIQLNDLLSIPSLLDFESDTNFDFLEMNSKIINGSINDLLNNGFQKFKETFLAYFINNEDIGLYGDNESTPCGFYCEIKVTNFPDYEIQNIPYPNNEFDVYFTIDNLRFGYFYEIEWKITKQVTPESPQSYEYTLRGDVKKYESLKLILPYIGVYDVELKIYHLHNNTALRFAPNLITVTSLNADFIGFTKIGCPNPQINEIPNLRIDDITGSVDRPIETELTVGEIDICIDSFDQGNYALVPPFRELNNYTLQNLKNATINDLSQFTIEQTEYALEANWVMIDDLPYPIDSLSNITINDLSISTVYADLPTSFVIFNLNNVDDTADFPLSVVTEIGNNIRIKNTFDTKVLNYGLVDKTNLVDVDLFLNALRTTFTNYEFNPLYKYDVFLDPIELDRITVTGKTMSDSLDCDVSYWTSLVDDGLNVYEYNNNNLVGDITGSSYMVNPSIFEIDLVKDFKVLSIYSQITFVVDNCKIPGKSNVSWILTNTLTNEVTQFSGKFFTMFFTVRGEYNIKAMLYDTNGNYSEIERKGILLIE